MFLELEKLAINNNLGTNEGLGSFDHVIEVYARNDHETDLWCIHNSVNSNGTYRLHMTHIYLYGSINVEDCKHLMTALGWDVIEGEVDFRNTFLEVPEVPEHSLVHATDALKDEWIVRLGYAHTSRPMRVWQKDKIEIPIQPAIEVLKAHYPAEHMLYDFHASLATPGKTIKPILDASEEIRERRDACFLGQHWNFVPDLSPR